MTDFLSALGGTVQPAQRRGFFARRVRRGDLSPRGYGYAWSRWDADEAVFVLIPLNVLARLGRRVWLWFVHGGQGGSGTTREAFDAGRRYEREQLRAYLTIRGFDVEV